MENDASRDRRVARAAAAGYWFLRVLGWTWRYRVSHDDELRRLRAGKQPVIFSLWHGQLLPLLYLHRHQGITLLISEHGDGEIIARIAMHLGYRTVRGSTSRGAARALLGLVRELRDGRDLGITPDGPRGPAESIAPGVLAVAQRGGAPILAIAARPGSAWHLKSWDRFMIPRPFAKVRVAYADTVRIEVADARSATLDQDRLRAAMNTAEQRASE